LSEHLSDIPATRAWEAYRAKWRSRQDLPVFIARRADAMHDELLARIAELEAERDALLALMREARDDFHGKAVLFSSRYLDAIRQTP